MTNVRNVCAKRYLYSPKQKGGTRSWETDERLNGVETLLSSMWTAIGADFVNLENEPIRKALSLFVASMHTRHPQMLDQVALLHEQIIEMLESAPRASDGTPNINCIVHRGTEYKLDTSGWKEYKSWGKEDHHRFFNEMILSQTGTIAKELQKKRWSVVFSEVDIFVTSDRPVSVKNREGFDCGINTPGAVITFPLSPTRILVIDDNYQEPANQYYALRPESIGAFNFATWHATARFLVTGRSVQEVLNEMLVWAEGEGYA